MRTVADLLENAQGLAEPEAGRRGRQLAQANAVQVVRFAPRVVTAELPADAAHVEFTSTNGELTWACTCREGRRGAFCAHCVATAIATGHNSVGNPA